MQPEQVDLNISVDASRWKMTVCTLRTNCEKKHSRGFGGENAKKDEKNPTLFVLNLVVGKVRNCRSKVSNVVHAGILNLLIKEKKIASVLLLKGVL